MQHLSNSGSWIQDVACKFEASLVGGILVAVMGWLQRNIRFLGASKTFVELLDMTKP